MATLVIYKFSELKLTFCSPIINAWSPCLVHLQHLMESGLDPKHNKSIKYDISRKLTVSLQPSNLDTDPDHNEKRDLQIRISTKTRYTSRVIFILLPRLRYKNAEKLNVYDLNFFNA